MAALFEILSSLDTRVSFGKKVDLNSIITAEEAENELSIIVFVILAQEASLKPQDELVLVEHLIQILLGGLWLKHVAVLERILEGSISIVRGYWVIELVCCPLGQFNGLLSYSELLLEVSLGESITIEDEAVLVVDLDSLSANKFPGGVVLFLPESHTWVMGKERLFRDLASAQKVRVGISSRILFSDFFNLDGVISQEVVHFVEVDTSAKSSIVPHDIE